MGCVCCVLQLYNMFPWLKPWVKNLKLMLKNQQIQVEEMKRIIRDLQETLNPQDPRGFIDSFLVRKQIAEVSLHGSTSCPGLKTGVLKV